MNVVDEHETPLYERIYALIRQIPAGKVATYGQIARMVGGCTARMVGYALSALPEGSDVPWQRVINIHGKISIHGIGGAIQKDLLIAEGVKFDDQEKINFQEVGWLDLQDRTPLPRPKRNRYAGNHY